MKFNVCTIMKPTSYFVNLGDAGFAGVAFHEQFRFKYVLTVQPIISLPQAESIS